LEKIAQRSEFNGVQRGLDTAEDKGPVDWAKGSCGRLHKESSDGRWSPVDRLRCHSLIESWLFAYLASGQPPGRPGHVVWVF